MDDYFNKALLKRKRNGLYRKLKNYNKLIDFSSNDYLGIANDFKTGSTGSRLISGNSLELEKIEKEFALQLNAKSALYFGSGYCANIGLIPAVADRFTTIISDEFIHASLIDGIRLSYGKKYSFKHNDLNHLEKLLISKKGKKIVIAETVYSMDGDSPDLTKLFDLISNFEDTYVILDEAHGLGLYGNKNLGTAQNFINHPKCLAVVYPLGKSLGLSGAFIIGSELLRDYLVNFSRSFIYSTGPSKSIIDSLQSQLESLYTKDISFIFELKNYFLKQISSNYEVLSGKYGAIVSILTREKSKNLEQELMNNNLFVKSILYPTVPSGQERLRICFHNYNTKSQVVELIKILNKSI